MTIWTSTARLGSRYLRAMRAMSPAAIALTLGLVLGGAGLADAATGGNFILGRANHESSQASLISSTGSALHLAAPAGKAPFSVNRNVQVNNLNAQFVGGQSASALQPTGGDFYSTPGTDTPIGTTDTNVAITGPLKAGTYYVTATAMLAIASGDVAGFCFIDVEGGPALDYGGTSAQGFVTDSETVVVNVTTDEAVEEWCYTEGNHGSVAFNAGLIAVRITSSSGTAPASPGSASRRPSSANRPGAGNQLGR